MRYGLATVALGALSALLLVGYPLGWEGCPLYIQQTLSLYGAGSEIVQPATCALDAVYLPPWALGAAGLALSVWYLLRARR